MKYCSKCVMPDTRPRLTFNENGVCAACEWEEIKRTQIDFQSRRRELENLCNQIRGKQQYDCIIPVSGGKDSTYVAHKMKHEFGLSVLTVTITPPLETQIIQDNLNAFLSYGYDNIKVTPNPAIMKEINKKGLIEQGRPLLGWTTCLNTVMLQMASAFSIPLIMFGEEGESEYGGSTKLRHTPFYDVTDSIDLYTYGNDPVKYASIFPEKELTMFKYPSPEDISKRNIRVAHWSYFENWDPHNHYIFARDHYGMKVKDEISVGTYTNFSQMDTPLYDLHTYFMYLKFGFGRCLQDACIDTRKGRIDRTEAVRLVEKYDGQFPTDLVDCYTQYYGMTRQEFQAVLERHTNKDLFEYKNGQLIRKFMIE